MVMSTRSSVNRQENQRRERLNSSNSSYTYEPRQQVQLETSGYKYIDQYLEYDCLLTPEELRKLGNHQYNAVDTSWLDELCMQKFWSAVVLYYPDWLAPNLITLIGLLINLITVLTLTYFCPTAKEVAPSWAYLLAAVGLFVYQTLDATDGKQARRIGCASPLGELFDHGCDSISQIFVTLNVCYALRLGQVAGGVFFVCVLAISIFYTAHWSTYCTGQLRFSRFDVTEAQMTVILLLLVTAICGPGIWSLGVLGFELRHLMLVGILLGSIYQGGYYVLTILTGGVGRNGATVAGTSVIFPIVALLACVIPCSMIYSKSNTNVFDENITLFVLFFGALGAKATNRIIVAHMTRSELGSWDWIYLAPIMLILNQYYNFVVSEKRLLVAASIYAYASLIIYCWIMCRQICQYMNIYCFKVTPRK